MSILAWVIIGVLSALVIFLLLVLKAVGDVVNQLFGGLIMGFGGPDIRKKK